MIRSCLFLDGVRAYSIEKRDPAHPHSPTTFQTFAVGEGVLYDSIVPSSTSESTFNQSTSSASAASSTLVNTDTLGPAAGFDRTNVDSEKTARRFYDEHLRGDHAAAGRDRDRTRSMEWDDGFDGPWPAEGHPERIGDEREGETCDL